MLEYFDDEKNLLKLIFFSILVLYFTTSVINVNLGHFLAIILIVSIVSLYLSREYDNSFEILDKLNYIRNSDEPVKDEFLYLDSEIIELLYNLKLDFYKYNKSAFENAIKAVNNLLKLRADSEKILAPQPKPINNNINDLDELNESLIQTETTAPLVNGYHVFEAAEIQYKLSINYIHSIIVNTPTNPVLRDKFNLVLTKLNVLLKRNLDIIYRAYMENKKDHQKPISHYDLYEPYIKYSDSFNFFA
jgi:hypothetical protein